MSNKPWDKEQLALQNLLKEIRKEAGFTQTELADQLDKPQSFVSKYEAGERKLDYLEVRTICLACGTTIAKFENRFSKAV